MADLIFASAFVLTLLLGAGAGWWFAKEMLLDREERPRGYRGRSSWDPTREDLFVPGRNR